MISKLKKLSIVILTAVAIVFLFIAGEIIVNKVYDIVSSGDDNKSAVFVVREDGGSCPDSILHHVHSPGAEYTWMARDKKEFSNLVEYNSKGLNDYEYSYEKPKDTVRILVFGDSFVEARAVEKNENFCKIIEKKLNPGNLPKKYEVINMGVCGYSPILEYLYLKNEGLKYEPDIVILCFFMNDVYDDSFYKKIAVFDNDNLPTKVSWKDPDPTNELIGWKRFERKISGSVKNHLNKSKIYVFIKKKLYLLLARLNLKKIEPEANPFFVLGNEISEKESGAWEDTFRYINAMKEMAQKNHAKFILITIPVKSQLSNTSRKSDSNFYFDEKPNSQRAEAKIAHFCELHNVDHISLLDEFKSQDGADLYFKNDGHFNKKGHREVADIILSRIETCK